MSNSQVVLKVFSSILDVMPYTKGRNWNFPWSKKRSRCGGMNM